MLRPRFNDGLIHYILAACTIGHSLAFYLGEKKVFTLCSAVWQQEQVKSKRASDEDSDRLPGNTAMKINTIDTLMETVRCAEAGWHGT